MCVTCKYCRLDSRAYLRYLFSVESGLVVKPYRVRFRSFSTTPFKVLYCKSSCHLGSAPNAQRGGLDSSGVRICFAPVKEKPVVFQSSASWHLDPPTQPPPGLDVRAKVLYSKDLTAAAANGCIGPCLRRNPPPPPAASLPWRWQRAGPASSGRRGAHLAKVGGWGWARS